MKVKSAMFIYSKEKNKFLLLFRANHPPNLSQKSIVKKEIKKEIKHELGLMVEDIFPLNWGSIYKLKNEEIKEMYFIAFISPSKLVSKEKSLKHKWISIEKFVEELDWNDNKELLKKVLKKGINKEVYFDKKEREN